MSTPIQPSGAVSNSAAGATAALAPRNLFLQIKSQLAAQPLRMLSGQVPAGSAMPLAAQVTKDTAAFAVPSR